MSGSGFKKTKLEEKILNSLNSFLRAGTSDTRLTKISVTKVKLNKDLSVAKVFWDSYELMNVNNLASAIDGVKGRLRSHLAQVLKIRHIPSLELQYDSQYQEEQKIEDILEAEQKEGKGF